MTYFNFLLIFICSPIALLSAVLWRERQRVLPAEWQTWRIHWVGLGLVVVALLYTTPWDNYLVATRVWWYDRNLVTGILLGWVPLEEYCFFILQTVLATLWWVWLAKRLSPVQPYSPNQMLRWWITALGASAWVASCVLLYSGWSPGTYLGLELVWGLFPLLIQLAFGGDILWHYRRLVTVGIVSITLYLAAADALAIGFGTWTINPAQSLNLFLPGQLPVEELIFFALTSALVMVGCTLLLSVYSHQRAKIRRAD
jgi:lycopene cyclase domain-containing protein